LSILLDRLKDLKWVLYIEKVGASLNPKYGDIPLITKSTTKIQYCGLTYKEIGAVKELNDNFLAKNRLIRNSPTNNPNHVKCLNR
jgi:hypothetical protein